MNILVCNAGSTSLKFKLISFPEERVLSRGRVERIGQGEGDFAFEAEGRDPVSGKRRFASYEEGIGLYLEYIGGADRADCAAFKCVLAKGFYGAHELTNEVIEAMDACLTVAPAHNRAYLAAVSAFKSAAPGLKLAASFETGFHQTMPLVNRVYPVPYEWYERQGVMRMGYHGASHEGMANAMAGYRRAVSCHLGGSGSICAILDGKSHDNSFGLSLQAGLPHVNRCGDIDPYIINYMVRGGMPYDEVIAALEKDSGLKGISGLSGDMRDLRSAAAQGNARARLAIDMYVNAVARYIGAYAAEMGGIDALGFTGGIGEKDTQTRAEVCGKLGFLGFELDPALNEASAPRIEKPGSKPVFVVKADEELTVARKVYGLYS